MKLRISGAWRDVTGGRVYVGGAWRNITQVRVYENGAWRQSDTFAPALSASASPSSVAGSRTGSGYVTTNFTTVTPTGGQPPFTYSWAPVGGALGVALAPSSASTNFGRSVLNGQQVTETFRCTVTDNFGTTVTADVLAVFRSFDAGGGGGGGEPEP